MIVSCGEALVDMVPDPVLGGGPMNVAIAAARLGTPAAFVGAVSTDVYGDQIMEHLAVNGVDTNAVQRSDRPTAKAIVEHTPELVFRFEGEDTADTMLGPVDLQQLTHPPTVVHGGTLGLFRGRTATTLADLATSHRGLVSLDPNVRPQIIDDRAGWDHFHDRWVAAADLYKASDEDLAWIWPDRPVEDGAQHLLDRGVGAVVVTRGSAGLEIFTATAHTSAPAPTVDVVDTVGAGDTTVAAILVALLERGVTGPDNGPTLASLSAEEWTAIAVGATEAAAVTCTRPGAEPPHRHELSW